MWALFQSMVKFIKLITLRNNKISFIIYLNLRMFFAFSLTQVVILTFWLILLVNSTEKSIKLNLTRSALRPSSTGMWSWAKQLTEYKKA